jgi:hypothetical protein
MASIIRPSWQQKPPLGFKINWNHPITNKLVSAWILNENGGKKVFDLRPGWSVANTIAPGSHGYAAGEINCRGLTEVAGSHRHETHSATGDIADGVMFLVGPESDYMSGQTLHINGGLVMS